MTQEMVRPPAPPGSAPTGFGRAARAVAVWAVFDLFMVLALFGPAPSAEALVRTLGALVASVLVAALLVWPVARRFAGRPFWLVLLVALPAFLLVQLVTSVVTG